MRRYRSLGRVDRPVRDTSADRDTVLTQARERVKARRALHEVEVSCHANDPRVKRLRELRGLLPKGSRNTALKAEQSELVAALWADDPKFWTSERLAVAMGQKSSRSAGRILLAAQQRDEQCRALGAGRAGTLPWRGREAS